MESLIPGVTGTVSLQLPGDTQLPVGTGWSAVHGPPVLRSWCGAGAGQAVPGDKDRDRDTIARLPVPPSGGQQALGGHSSPRPSRPGQTPPSLPCLPQPHPHRSCGSRHVLPAPLPRSLIPGDCVKHHRGRDRGIYSRYCSLITSSPVLPSHWVFTLRGASTGSWPGSQGSAGGCSLREPLKPLL